ncbi:MAG: GerMN domain-containing protein [Candidatus Gastranaerophilaceae bacterium]
MTKWQKIGLASLVIGTLAFIKVAYFPGSENVTNEQIAPEEQTSQDGEGLSEDVPKSYVNIYFIGQNDNKEEVYKVVKREYQAKTDGTKLKFSIENLLKGPDAKEKAKGIYSEIPQGTRLISLEETPNKVIINLSGDFEQGGGTDGLYKRLYQIIKTSNKNTTLDVYLYINGKKADVIGGEGIMINQPLSEKSLEE